MPLADFLCQADGRKLPYNPSAVLTALSQAPPWPLGKPAIQVAIESPCARTCMPYPGASQAALVVMKPVPANGGDVKRGGFDPLVRKIT